MLVAPLPLPLRVRDGDQSIYNPKIKVGVNVRYKGRDYKIVEDKGKSEINTPALKAQQSQTGLSASFWGVVERFENMLSDFSPRSFETNEARLSRLLTTPEQRKFLVDVDSTLWYKGKRSEEFPGVEVDKAVSPGNVPNPEDGIDLNALSDGDQQYISTTVSRNGVATPVLVSVAMLKFLKDQSDLGVPLCITSTGKTDSHEDAEKHKQAQSLETLFARCGINTNKEDGSFQFQNYKDLKNEFRQSHRRFPMIKMFLKYMTKGDVDKNNPNRRHIMIDDQWYHRMGWKQPAINSADLGMG
jgi:hypothetical protein